jgi:hypothetical protein
MFDSVGSRCGLSVRYCFVACLSVLAITSHFGQHCDAGLFSLEDDNSTASFNTGSPSNNSNWSVDGENQLNQQAFWFRVGNAAEQSLHTLPILAESATDTNLDFDLDTLFVRYNGGAFWAEVRYALDGGTSGSGSSDMSEQISIINRTGAPLNFHFFQYSDFNISNTANDDTAVFTNANAVQQYDGGIRLTETVITPVPSHREIDFFPNTLTKLNDGVASNLSDTPAYGAPLGPGNMTWAYQWDVTIPAGGTFQVSKDKNLNAQLIPEPGTFTMLAIAGVLASLVHGRRRLFS